MDRAINGARRSVRFAWHVSRSSAGKIWLFFHVDWDFKGDNFRVLGDAIVLALVGVVFSILREGKVVEWLSVNFPDDCVRGREYIDCKSDSDIESGSSEICWPVIVDKGSEISAVGVVAVLDRPDILRMMSRLLFFTGPGPAVVENNGGKPEICLATLNRIRSLRDKGAPGA
jgi:hypothetical protein